MIVCALKQDWALSGGRPLNTAPHWVQAATRRATGRRRCKAPQLSLADSAAEKSPLPLDMKRGILSVVKLPPGNPNFHFARLKREELRNKLPDGTDAADVALHLNACLSTTPRRARHRYVQEVYKPM